MSFLFPLVDISAIFAPITAKVGPPAEVSPPIYANINYSPCKHYIWSFYPQFNLHIKNTSKFLTLIIFILPYVFLSKKNKKIFDFVFRNEKNNRNAAFLMVLI